MFSKDSSICSKSSVEEIMCINHVLNNLRVHDCRIYKHLRSSRKQTLRQEFRSLVFSLGFINKWWRKGLKQGTKPCDIMCCAALGSQGDSRQPGMVFLFKWHYASNPQQDRKGVCLLGYSYSPQGDWIFYLSGSSPLPVAQKAWYHGLLCTIPLYLKVGS